MDFKTICAVISLCAALVSLYYAHKAEKELDKQQKAFDKILGR